MNPLVAANPLEIILKTGVNILICDCRFDLNQSLWGSGVTASHNMLAMENAGLSGSQLYAGSWNEWCADPKRPVEI